jgi:hypothetical protein
VFPEDISGFRSRGEDDGSQVMLGTATTYLMRDLFADLTEESQLVIIQNYHHINRSLEHNEGLASKHAFFLFRVVEFSFVVTQTGLDSCNLLLQQFIVQDFLPTSTYLDDWVREDSGVMHEVLE